MTSVFYVVRLRSSLPREFLAIKLFGTVRLSDCFNWSLSWCSSRLYQHVPWVLPESQLLIKLLCYLRSCLWFHKNKSNKLFFQKNYLGQVTSHLLRKIKEGNKKFLQKVPPRRNTSSFVFLTGSPWSSVTSSCSSKSLIPVPLTWGLVASAASVFPYSRISSSAPQWGEEHQNSKELWESWRKLDVWCK